MKTKHHLIIFSLFTTFATVLLLPYLDGHWRLADDAYRGVLPFWSYQERILGLGEWPHWNTNEGIGKPLAVSSGSGLFYPVSILWGVTIGWSELSYLWFLILHLAAGGYLATLFALRTGMTASGAVLFGSAFIGNGYVLGLLSNPTLIAPYFFWPLLGIALLELHQKSADKKSAVLKLATGLVLIEAGGYPLTKLIIYAVTFGGYFAWVKKPGKWLEGPAWKPLIWAGAGAVVITVPEWSSTFRTLHLSDRLGMNIYNDVMYGSPTNFFSFATLLLPSSFLRRDEVQIGMVWLERSWWIGSLTIALIAAGFYSGKVEFKRFKIPAALAFLAFLFALGGHSFFRELSSLALPILEHLRFSNNARLVPMALIAFVGGHCLSVLENKTPAAPKKDSTRILAGLWVAYLLLCTVFALMEADWARWSSDLYVDAGTGWKMGVLHTGFYLLLAYTAFHQRWVALREWRWPAILVAIHLLSLADAGYSFRHVIAYPHEGKVRRHEDFQLAVPHPNKRSVAKWLENDDWISWHGNQPALNAYSTPPHRNLAQVKNDRSIWPYLGSLVSCEQDSSHVLPPPSEQLSCAGVSFQVNRYYGNVIEVFGSSTSPSVILVHDSIDPYWSASLNGQPVEIREGRKYFKAIHVPALPDWKIRLEYRDPWYPWLWFVSRAGMLLLIFVPKRMLE